MAKTKPMTGIRITLAMILLVGGIIGALMLVRGHRRTRSDESLDEVLNRQGRAEEMVPQDGR